MTDETVLFDKIIKRMESKGWVEDCPRFEYWTFSKKNWECRLYWASGHVKFIRHQHALWPNFHS